MTPASNDWRSGMTEIEAAPALIAQTGADALMGQLAKGLLTPDEYRVARGLVALEEDGPRCLYCASAAYIGQTCAAHADLSDVAVLAHARFPVIDYTRYPDRNSFIAAV